MCVYVYCVFFLKEIREELKRKKVERIFIASRNECIFIIFFEFRHEYTNKFKNNATYASRYCRVRDTDGGIHLEKVFNCSSFFFSSILKRKQNDTPVGVYIFVYFSIYSVFTFIRN